jgi:hypothetical protein
MISQKLVQAISEQIGPERGEFQRTPRRISESEDWVAERVGFELSGDFLSGQ